MNLRSYSDAHCARQGGHKTSYEKAAGSSNPAASMDHHNMHNIPNAAGSGDDEMHLDMAEVRHG